MISYPPLRRRLKAATAVAVLLAAGACTENSIARREGVTAEAGNAKAINMVQMVTDTMPRSAKRTTLTTDGTRMSKVIEYYRNPPPPEASGGESGDSSPENAVPSQ